MNIILVSDKLGRTATLRLSSGQLALALAVLLGLAFWGGAWLRPKLGDQSMLVTSMARTNMGEQLRYNRYITTGLATRLGELQAKLLRIDTGTERLAQLLGVKPQDLRLSEAGGRGGPYLPGSESIATLVALNKQIDEFALLVLERRERFDFLDQLLREDRVKRSAIPTTPPLKTGYYSSNFGYRSDPFTGGIAFHNGIDFMAERGTAIYAAAGGVVVGSELAPDYGNFVEIDHGNGLSTRYGHASKRLVDVGDIVLKGQKIAEVGNTGRSTGPHLHFEVRSRGVPLNPIKFLRLRG